MSETKQQKRYRLNTNGYRDKCLEKSRFSSQIKRSREELLKTMPTEELLGIVGWDDDDDGKM